MIFNLPDFRVVKSEFLDTGLRRITVATTFPPGCPSCGVIASRRKARRLQRVRDIPVAGAVEVVWSKRRWFCGEELCPRKSFSESAPQVPRFARSTVRLKDALVSAVIRSGRVVSETAASYGVSWWMVQQALHAAAFELPDVDRLRPRMLGIDEHRFRSVRFFKDPKTGAWSRYEPWMTTIVDLDTGQVLGIVDGRDSRGVGDWLFKRPLEWRLGVQVVAIDPSAAFRKALAMWLPRTAVSVDHFHLVKLANEMLTEVRQGLSQTVRGRRGRATDPAWAHRQLLLRAGDTLSKAGLERLAGVFAADDPTGRLQAAWDVKEQLRLLLRTGSLGDAAAAKEKLRATVEHASMPETNRLWRTVNKWWKEIEVLIVTGATTAKVEANNTTIKNIKRAGRGYRNPWNYRSRILLVSAAKTTA